jgi:hypothetical protein
VELVPVFHLGAVLGTAAPFWDSRDGSATPTCW